MQCCQYQRKKKKNHCQYEITLEQNLIFDSSPSETSAYRKLVLSKKEFEKFRITIRLFLLFHCSSLSQLSRHKSIIFGKSFGSSCIHYYLNHSLSFLSRKNEWNILQYLTSFLELSEDPPLPFCFSLWNGLFSNLI